MQIAEFANCEPALVRGALGNLLSSNVMQADPSVRRASREEREDILAVAAKFERALAAYRKLPDDIRTHISDSAFDEVEIEAEMERFLETLRLEADVSGVPWRSYQAPRANRINWPARVIARAVSRVFVAAGTPMTVGKSFDGDPTGAFAKAVKFTMDHYGVAGDWRGAAEAAKTEAGSGRKKSPNRL